MIETGNFYTYKRDKERTRTNLNAQYFIKKHSSQYLDCHILNLSCSGAAVSLPINEKPAQETAIFLDMFIPKTLMRVSVVGGIKRTERRDNKLIECIRFTEFLSPLTFQQLTGPGLP